jgi:hypothetical protein
VFAGFFEFNKKVTRVFWEINIIFKSYPSIPETMANKEDYYKEITEFY